MKSINTRLERLEKYQSDTISPEVRKWVEDQVQAYRDAYNSPEAMRKREEMYQEVQRIGKLRKAAFERGESMEQYPLPWEPELTEEEKRFEKILKNLKGR